MGFYGSLTVFADLSVVFPFGFSRSFQKLCDPQRPTKTIWKPGFSESFLKADFLSWQKSLTSSLFSFAVIIKTRTRCLVENFQLICYSQEVRQKKFEFWNGQTIAWLQWKKRLQRRITTDYCWIGGQENIFMFCESWSDRKSFNQLPLFERPVRPMFNCHIYEMTVKCFASLRVVSAMTGDPPLYQICGNMTAFHVDLLMISLITL